MSAILKSPETELFTETGGVNYWMFESSPDCAKILDLEGRLVSMNKNGQCIMDVDEFSLINGRLWTELWPIESHGAIQAALDAARSGKGGRFNAFCPTAKGRPKWWDVIVTPIANEEGQVERILSVSRDITEVQKTKEELRENVAQLQFLLEAGQIGEWDMDLTTGIIHHSLRHDLCFGYTEPVANWNFDDFIAHIYPDDRQRVQDAYKQAVAESKDWHLECRVVWPDKSVHWILVQGAVYRTLDNKPTQFLGIIADITERKRTEALAVGQKKALEMAVAGAPLASVLNVLTLAAEEATGHTIMASVLLLDVDGKRLWQGSAPSLPAGFSEAINGVEIGPSVGSCGTAAFFAKPVVVRDIQSDPLWADFRELALSHGLHSCWSQPILSAYGKVLGTLAAYRGQPWEPTETDRESMQLLLNTAALVLDRHRAAEERTAAEQALRESERQAVEAAHQAESERRRFDALLEAAPVGIVMVDAVGKVVKVNRENRQIWGDVIHYPETVKDYRDWKGWWADGSEKHGQRLNLEDWVIARALNGEEEPQNIVEIEPFGAPGVRKTIIASGAPIRDASGKVSGAVLAQMDITERVQAETALRRSEAHLSSLFGQSMAGIAETDMAGRFVQVNDRYCEILGRPREEIIGRTMQDFTHPDDFEKNLSLFTHMIGTGEAFEIEKRYVRPDDLTVWASVTVSLIHTPGANESVLAIVLDTTDRKKAEEELRRAGRRKDEFLAMLAHELRNPLAPIAAAADLLPVISLDQNRVQQTSAIISRQVKHMTGLIDDLLDVSRVTRGLATLNKGVLDVKSVVADAIEQVRPLIEARSHRMTVHLSAQPSLILGDKKRLVQVVANLLNNAAKYTPEGGTIVLSMDVSQNEVIVSVADNGAGMAPELVEHVFEPFIQAERTADRSQGGLGIGLALVRSLVELHEGSVVARSDGIGMGSEFIVRLPRMHGHGAQVQTPERKLPNSVPSEALRVLVVDDNIDAANMLGMFLEAVGHAVFIEHQSTRALQLAKSVQPDVCLLDIGLPDMNGNELALRLREIPETAAATLIAVTGYGQQQDKENTLAAGFDHHFVKPVDMKQLNKLISDIAHHKKHFYRH